MREIKGIIEKGIGGFYYVRTQNGDLLECKARGLFRKEGICPLAAKGRAIRSMKFCHVKTN